MTNTSALSEEKPPLARDAGGSLPSYVFDYYQGLNVTRAFTMLTMLKL